MILRKRAWDSVSYTEQRDLAPLRSLKSLREGMI